MKGKGVPLRHSDWKLLFILLATLALVACGSSTPDSDDLPPMPPTMTPDIQPTPVVTPTAVPDGEKLMPLGAGQEVQPNDRHYSIVMPQFWVQGTAPPAELAYRESGGAVADRGYAYNVMREQLPADVRTAQDFADAGLSAAEERLTDVDTISMEPVQVAGVQAIRWVYTATITSEKVLIHQVYLVDGGTGFLLTGSAPADGDLDAAHALFDSIAGSFSFPRG